jgi:small subunit ribosomal protein S2
MASLVQDLVEAGIHFGHRTTNWNPKMAPYIFGKRNKIHIIDIKSTVKGLLLARKFLTKVVGNGQDVLFVGTKRQAQGIIESKVREVGMHWVTERWLGGTLTNFRTIRERLKRLEELEHLIESGEINNYSKKMESQLHREKDKILRNLDGLRNMTKLPGAMVVVDVAREVNALREARKLGISTVCLIDTDSDPDLADIPIPGNDDSMRAIEVVLNNLCAAVAEGKQATAEAEKESLEAQATEGASASADGGAPRRRRSSRARFRADEPGGESPEPSYPPEPAADATKQPNPSSSVEPTGGQ